MLSDDISTPQSVSGSNIASSDGRFQRVQVSVLGRYMLADRREFPCQILAMSPGDAVVIAPVAGIVGERIIAYLDHIGRIEGTIIHQVDGGFVMDIAASPRKRDKMAAQLTWLANKDLLNLPEDRRHERVVPDIRHSTVVLDDGRRYNCKIIDISLSGAAIELEVRPAMGTPITLGRMRARRHPSLPEWRCGRVCSSAGNAQRCSAESAGELSSTLTVC